MPDCTFTEDEQAAIDAAAKWAQYQQAELLAVQLAALITDAGLTIGEGCEFSEDELTLIEQSKKWSQYSVAELLAIQLAALNP